MQQKKQEYQMEYDADIGIWIPGRSYFIGAVLLWLPISNRQPIVFYGFAIYGDFRSLRDGPCHHTPAAQFTIFGKVILLFLIQIGGLGVIACATVFFLISSQADYCKGAGGDTGDLQHGLPRRHGGHGEAGDYRGKDIGSE